MREIEFLEIEFLTSGREGIYRIVQVYEILLFVIFAVFSFKNSLSGGDYRKLIFRPRLRPLERLFRGETEANTH